MGEGMILETRWFDRRLGGGALIENDGLITSRKDRNRRGVVPITIIIGAVAPYGYGHVVQAIGW